MHVQCTCTRLRPMGDNPIESISHDNIITAYGNALRITRNTTALDMLTCGLVWSCRVVAHKITAVDILSSSHLSLSRRTKQCMPHYICLILCHLVHLLKCSSLLMKWTESKNQRSQINNEKSTNKTGIRSIACIEKRQES